MLGFSSLGQAALGETVSYATSAAVAGGAATFTLTGNDVGLYANRLLTADAAAFTLTFFSADLARARKGLNVRGGGGARGLMTSAGGGARGLRIRA